MNLQRSEAHVWRVDLNSRSGGQEHAVLSPAERARSDKFVRIFDRDRYLRSHVALRKILAIYVDCNPARIEMEVGSEGKPRLAGAGLRFNLSHSAHRALVAVTCDGEIGVDVEERREIRNYMNLAQQFCSLSEFQRLQQKPAADQPLAFLTCWTRKEALLKATGAGLRNLDQTEVGIDPECSIVQTWYRNSTTDFQVQTLLHWPTDVVSVAAPRTTSRMRFIDCSWNSVTEAVSGSATDWSMRLAAKPFR